MAGLAPPGRPRLTIRQQLVLGSAIIGLLLFVAGGISVWQIDRLTDAVAVLQVTSARSATALRVRQNSTQLVAMVSRLLPVEDATAFETEVAEALDALQESHAALVTLAEAAEADDPAYPLMKQVCDRVDSVIGIAETMVRQASAEQWPSVRVRVGVLDRDHDQLAQTTNALVDLTVEMEESAARQVASARRAALLYPALAVALSMALGALLTWQTTRSIAGPVEQLTEAATHLAAGSLDKRVAVERADELGQLAAAFNQMAERLQTSHAELERRVADRTVDLQRAMHELAQERNMLNATLDALPDLLFEVDRHGRIHDFRAPRLEALHLPPEEFLGQPVARVLPEEAVTVILGALNQAIETGRHTGALYALETPAGLGWFELSIAAKGDPGAPDARFIALVRDVTARVKAEAESRMRLKEQTALREAGAVITSTLDLSEVLGRIAEQMGRAVDATSAYICRHDQQMMASTVIAEYASPQASALEKESDLGVVYSYQKDDEAFLEAMQAGRYDLSQVDDLNLAEFERVHMQRYGARTILYIPLRIRERFIGYVELWETRRRREFAPEEIGLCQSMAQQAAVAIENAQLYDQAQQEIAERKRAEEALRRRNRDLALLNRASRAFGAILNLDQVLVNVLEEVRHLLGVAASSVWLIDPQTDELVCRQATGPQADVVRGWRLAPGEGIVGWVVQEGESLIVPDIRADERHFTGVDQQTGLALRSILTVPLQVKQEVIGAIQVMDTEVDRFSTADLTLLEPLAASAAIAVDNAGLIGALRQRTIELENSNKELDAFVHTVAHDLKNPLGPIVGFAEVLRRDHDTMSGDELRRYLRKIAQSGRKMSSIIDELLLLARLREVPTVGSDPLDMASIVAEAEQRLAHVIEERQATIIRPETWPVALGHAPWVEEIWVNYLSNALKYGGSPPRIELGATVQADGMVVFWVRDNGPGLSPEDQARLFVPYTRLDRVRAKGHGLGLSIVQRIVEKMDGQVGMESELGRGSAFTFSLPSAGRSALPDSPPPAV